MNHPSGLSISDFSYDLPEDRIAFYPLSERDASKLLIYNNKSIDIDEFSSLPGLLPKGSLLVFNDTRVINARVVFLKKTGGRIEIFCLEPAGRPDDFREEGFSEWICLIGGAAKWKGEILEKDMITDRGGLKLQATMKERTSSGFIIRFSWQPADFNFEEVLALAGDTPLPPYIKRKAEEKDKERYQTIYAKRSGSVAAPTAGLHFTEKVMEGLREKSMGTGYVTLHVGAGTFKPVDAETMEGHNMHAEWISVDQEMIKRLATHLGPVTAVGTTSARTLETLYWLGARQILDKENDALTIKQWDVYEVPLQGSDISRREAMEALLERMKQAGMSKIITQTELMIAPGYKYRMIDSIITNFHQPRSTLLLLVAAAVGDNWKKIYRTALENDFRFLSYGDSSLLFIDQG